MCKRRFLIGDVSRFIRSVFNLEQQALCSRAKYNKTTKMAVVPNVQGQMDIIDAVATPGSGFAIETVTRSPALQPLKYSGLNNKAMEYYNFADGQSITTIKTATKKTVNSSDSVNSTGQSSSKASDALHLGEESMELELPETPTFAVVLEDITNKDYSIMLDIIKSISSAIPKSAEDDEPRTEIPDNIQHHLFTQALRDALKSDLIGSDESLSEYLDCMIMAIEDAQKITEGYLTDSNDVDMENEATNTPLLLLPASESDDTAAKLQGCAEDTDTNMTTAEAVGETSIVPADTARLGADQE